MAVATIEAYEAVASSVFVQIMGTPIKNCWSGSFWSFLVTSPRPILRSGYGDGFAIKILNLFDQNIKRFLICMTSLDCPC